MVTNQRSLKLAIAFAAALTLPNPCFSEDEPQPWYEVELIFFEHQSAERIDEEFWPEDVQLGEYSDVIELVREDEETEEGEIDPSLEDSEATGTVEITGPDDTDTIDSDPNADPELSDAESEAPALEGELTEEETTDATPALEALVPFDETRFRLSEQLQALIDSKNYQPLIHLAWQQPVEQRGQSRAIHIASELRIEKPLSLNEEDITESEENTDTTIIIPAPETPLLTAEPLTDELNEEEEPIDNTIPVLEGFVDISVGRYLHLNVDLLFHREITETLPPPEVLEDETETEFNTFQATPLIEELPTTITRVKAFHIQNRRRMRSTEIHYLDHPLIGVIALFTPVEIVEEDEVIDESAGEEEGGEVVPGNE